MTTNARTPTLADLRQRFEIQLQSSDRFFDDWLVQAPPISELEAAALERIQRNYEYLSQAILTY